MNRLRKDHGENDPPDVEFARGTLVMAKQSLAEVKRLDPDYSSAKYEREIAEYDRMMSDTARAVDSLDEVKAFIRKTAYASEQLTSQTYWKGIFTQTKGDAERYFEKCKELNYGETIKQVNAALA